MLWWGEQIPNTNRAKIFPLPAGEKHKKQTILPHFQKQFSKKEAKRRKKMKVTMNIATKKMK